jgi:transcriptional regulator of NAD metabolism
MIWDISKKGWLRYRLYDRDKTQIGRMILRLVTEREKAFLLENAPELECPVYVLSTIFVDKRFRRNSFGKEMLELGRDKLLELHDEVVLGLMTDNFKDRPGQTKEDIKKLWEKFVEEQGCQVENGYIIIKK